MGQDVLSAMTTLGFENYAEALSIYLIRYHQTMIKESSVSHTFYPSSNCKTEEAAISPTELPRGSDGHESETRGVDVFSTAKNPIASHEHNEDNLSVQNNAALPRKDWSSKQDTKKEPANIVDHLLAEWTLLREFR